MKRICRDCGKEFELNEGEIQFYHAKKLSLPKRCKDCREKKKYDGSRAGKQVQQVSAPNKKIGGRLVYGNDDAREKSMAQMDGRNRQSSLEENGGWNIKSSSMAEQDDRNAENGSIAEKSSSTGNHERVSTQEKMPYAAQTDMHTESVRTVPTKSGKGKKVNSIWAAVLIFLVLVSGLFGNQFLGSASDNERESSASAAQEYHFRNDRYLEEHFEKHGGDFDYTTKEEYEAGANKVISSDEALHKLEAEDGDDVYYLEAANEFVIVSTDGYIRTYFKPEDGIDYYNRQ